jgi:uncharacterized membrane protein
MINGITWLRHHLFPTDAWSFLERSLFVFGCALAVFFTVFVPPFQKPDEATHFNKAVSLARGNIVCKKAGGDVFENYIPSYLADLPNTLFAKHIYSSKNIVFPPSLYVQTLTKTDWDKTLVNEPSSCSLPALLYLPTALVIAIPVWLSGNPLIIFYLGRFANVGLALIVCWQAVKKTPRRLRLIPLFMMTLPIFAHQISSYSKDALHLSFGLLVFSYLLHFHEEHKKITPAEIVSFFGSLLIVVFARPQYVPLALTAFLIPRQKTKVLPLTIRQLTVGFLIGVLLLIGVALSLEIFSAKAVSLGNGAPKSFIYPDLQLSYLLESPGRYLQVLNTTFEQKFIFFSHGAVGLLGYFEYGVEWWLYPLYAGLGWYVLFHLSSEWRPLALKHWLVLSLALIGCLTGLTLAMYLYGTPVAQSSIDGLQGRYFLLFIPFGYWWVSTAWNRWRNSLLLGGFILAGMSVGWLVISRYYINTAHSYVDAQWLSDGATINRSAREVAVPITSTAMEIINVEPGKKLAGLVITTVPNTQKITQPYELSIFDKDCRQQLRTAVVTANSLNTDYVGKTIQVSMLPLKIPASGELCVEITLFGDQIDPTETLLLYPTTHHTLTAPLYLN